MWVIKLIAPQFELSKCYWEHSGPQGGVIKCLGKYITKNSKADKEVDERVSDQWMERGYELLDNGQLHLGLWSPAKFVT